MRSFVNSRVVGGVQQASDPYIVDGTIDDWLWGRHEIFGDTFEMCPTTSSPGFSRPTRSSRRRRRATVDDERVTRGWSARGRHVRADVGAG